MEAEGAGGTIAEVRGLVRRFPARGRGGRASVPALDGADLVLRAGGFHALVGQSGCGKSTLARCLAGLDRADSGSVLFRGKEVGYLRGAALRRYRRQVQLIFQDPAGALNPRFRAWEVVAEPMAILGQGSQRERRRHANALMTAVGLPAEWAERRPLEFSGGQRQRLAIARALAVEPALLILDEALSGLDPSIQGQILNLLRDLQEERSFTCLLVSHDLAVVAAVAEDITVMHQGRVVERAPAASLLRAPSHSHSRALVAAALTQGSRLEQASRPD